MRAARGFSLVELLVAVGLVGIVFAAVLSLQDSLLRDKGKVLRHIAVRNQADYSRRLILREMAETTVVEWPSPGVGADELYGFKNVDGRWLTCQSCGAAPNTRTICRPAANPCKSDDQFTAAEKQNFISLVDLDGDGLTAFGDDSSYFRFCWTADQRLMYYHGPISRGGNDVNFPPSTVCGQPKPNASAGEEMEAIAGVPAGTVRVLHEPPPATQALFFRPVDRKNFIELEYVVVSTGTIGGGVGGAIIDSAKADVEARALALLPAR